MVRCRVDAWRAGLVAVVVVGALAGVAVAGKTAGGYMTVVSKATWANADWRKVVDALAVKHGAALCQYDTSVTEALATLNELTPEAIETLLRTLAEEKQVGLGKIAQPLRVAICGNTISPPIFDAVDMLGINTVLKRIENMLVKFKKEKE